MRAKRRSGEAAKPTQRLRQSRIPFARSSGERMSKIRFKTKRPKPAAARLYASTAPGVGPRPCRSFCTCSEYALFAKVRILENPDVCFGILFSRRCAFRAYLPDCTRAPGSANGVDTQAAKKSPFVGRIPPGRKPKPGFAAGSLSGTEIAGNCFGLKQTAKLRATGLAPYTRCRPTTFAIEPKRQ